MRAVLTNHATVTERAHQLGGAIEVRQFDVRGADALGIVCVGADPRRQLERSGKLERGQIVGLIGDFRIEYFDDVQVALRGEGLEHWAPQSSPLGIERVRRVDQSSLSLNSSHHFGHRQHVGDPLSQKQPDQFSRGRPNLFANDHTHPKIPSQGGLGCLYRVVVSDAHHVKSNGFDAFEELVKGCARIAGRARVHMTIKTNKASGSGWRRPNGIQQQEGD